MFWSQIQFVHTTKVFDVNNININITIHNITIIWFFAGMSDLKNFFATQDENQNVFIMYTPRQQEQAMFNLLGTDH